MDSSDERHDDGDEQQLASLHAKIEEEQGKRNGVGG